MQSSEVTCETCTLTPPVPFPTHPSAMFSEAVHTLVDVGNQAILRVGLLQAERVPDHAYQYGYGRAAFFYSLIAALSTFGFGSLYTLYEGIHVLLSPPEALVTSYWTSAVLGFSFLVDGFVLTKAWQDASLRARSSGLTTTKVCFGRQ
eukprot:m.220319 g.220319  ORF g.220319 m.220319 type:complete len:148 (-) comp18701_c0_seq12:352-795(-)